MRGNVIGSIILEGAATTEDVIVSDSKDKKRVIAEGVLQTLGDENRNHRIYAKEDMEPEVYGPRLKELIKAKQLYGEMGHPLSDDLVRQQSIDIKLACTNYIKVWIEGDKIKGQFKGTNNDYGAFFDSNLREGALPAFSLRALGSIENINGKAYVKNIKIITWDYVIYPSHKGAYTERIVSESAMDGTPVSENQIMVPYDDPGRIINLNGSDAKTYINRLQRESANFSNILEAVEGRFDKLSIIDERNVIMTSKYGEKVTVYLEDFIDNNIMDFAFKN